MMHDAPLGAQLIVGLLAAVIVTGALWVVSLRNLFRAALSLGVVLLGVAGLFIAVQAEFLGFVQILVYVGAILTMVVFAVMLTAKLQDPSASPAGRQRGPAAAVSAAVFGLLAWLVCRWPWPEPTAEQAVTLPALGKELVTTLVLPFEVISVVFVVAMVGAIVLAAGPKRSNGSAP